jgi:hypothetical protein
MPIEFRCPACSKLLRTPDESAGKKAKCPDCGEICDVPVGMTPPVGGSDFPPRDTGGFAAKPMDDASNPFGEMPSDTDNPYASPTAPAWESTGKMPSGPRQGLPWESEGKSIGSFWRTSKMVFMEPAQAFRVMRREGGLGDPIIFAMIGGLFGGLITAIYNSILQVAMIALAAAGGGPEAGTMVGIGAFQIVMNFVGAIAGGTIGVIIGLFIGTAITHVALMLFKGANYPFETTFRVMSYVAGATALLQVIPLMGTMVQLVASIIYEIIGLIHAQETTGGKATAAVLVPMFLCCLLVVALFGLGMFAFFAAMQSANM